jgi:TetR/AcrR family transcriptional regulator, mexJK operon transcriptional repressor
MTSMTATDPAAASALSPKAEQVLQAASSVFREQGYGSASMDAIARRAGVSKATLYAHFAGKDELFAAIVGAECRSHSQTLAAPDIDRLDVRQTLSAIGRNFLELVLSAKARAIYRIVMAEAPRFPELGRAFYASGPAVVLARLADYLGAADARGALRVEDPRLAAEQFIGMLMGPLHMRHLLGLTAEFGDRDPEQVVGAAVTTFLAAYAPDDPAGSSPGNAT